MGDAHAVPLRSVPVFHAVGADGAEAHVAQMLAEAEIARDEAVADGWRQGYETGVAEGRDELQGAISAVHSMLEQLTAAVADAPERLADDVAALGLEVAARLVRADLAANPERVVDVVRGAIRKATDRERLIAYVNPDDLETMRASRDDLMTQMGGIHRFEVIEDPRIQPGGCILETTSGDIDARMHTQLERLLEALAAPPDPTLLAEHGG
ncbi:MAG: hypothetical protein H6531_02345 [Actinobacteria bacterium]|nr:hypothetical protein [Thermoleophilia bacterium]MCB9010654.1 hypothetical protein [Actinomycetota bacterium]